MGGFGCDCIGRLDRALKHLGNLEPGEVLSLLDWYSLLLQLFKTIQRHEAFQNWVIQYFRFFPNHAKSHDLSDSMKQNNTNLASISVQIALLCSIYHCDDSFRDYSH